MIGPIRTRLSGGIVGGIVLLAAGWLLVALALRLGYDAASAEYTGTPVCDGQDMGPGDYCISIGRGSGRSGTYEQIVAERKREAKSDAWSWAEATGGFGALLVFAGAASDGFRGRLRPRAGAWLMIGTAAVPLLGVAGAVWWLQARADAASPVSVGIVGEYWPWPSVPYSAVLTVAAVAFVSLGLLVNAFSTGSGSASRVAPGFAAVAAVRRPAGVEERLRAFAERSKAAGDPFRKGETDDRWASARVAEQVGPGGRAEALRVRLIRGLGAAVFLTACVLSVGHWALGGEVPAAAPGLCAVAGYMLFTWYRVQIRPPGAVAWRSIGCALLSLAADGAALLSLPAATWIGLLNVLVFTGGFLVLTGIFGPSLPRPPVAGRVVCTANGVVQLFVAARLFTVARAGASDAFVEFVSYLLAAVLVLGSWVSFGNAHKTEFWLAVPAGVSAACLGGSALLLAFIACGVAFADVGPFGWAVEAGYTVASLVQARGAFDRLSMGRRPARDRPSTAVR